MSMWLLIKLTWPTPAPSQLPRKSSSIQCHHTLKLINSIPRIKKGDPVTRLAVVLVTGSSSVQVAYLATFAQSTKLPASFADKSLWYPISPATKESTYAPLSALPNSKAQWACLRKKQTITENPVGYLFPPPIVYIPDAFVDMIQVKKVQESLSKSSADLILAAMKA